MFVFPVLLGSVTSYLELSLIQPSCNTKLNRETESHIIFIKIIDIFFQLVTSVTGEYLIVEDWLWPSLGIKLDASGRDYLFTTLNTS